MVVQVLQLSKLQIRAVFTDVLGEEYPENQPLPDVAVFYLLLADLLEKLAFLSPEQRSLVLKEMHKALKDQWAVSATFLHDLDLASVLVFYDNAYVTWVGQQGFLSLETGERVEKLPRPALEAIGYNLSELYARGKYKIEARSGKHVKKHNEGSVAES